MWKAAKRTVLAVAVLAAWPAAAADGLACMDRPFPAEDQAFLNEFMRSFDLDEWGATGGGEHLAQLMADRGDTCAAEFGWSDTAVEHAFMWRAGILLEQALKTSSPLSRDDLKLVEQAIAAADQARLMRIMGPQVDVEYFGNAEPTNADLVYLEQVVVGSGVTMTDEVAIFTGALIAAKLTQAHSAARFAES